MDVFDLQARIGLDVSDYEKGLLDAENSIGKLKNTVKNAVSGISSASAAAAEGISAVVSSSADSAENCRLYQNTLNNIFGNDIPAVIRNAGQALDSAGKYTAGYLSSAADASSSLIQRLGSDAEKTAGIADISFKNILAGYSALYEKLSSLSSLLDRQNEKVRNTGSAFAEHSGAVKALGAEYAAAAVSCISSRDALDSLFAAFRNYAGTGSSVISNETEKIKKANENMLASFLNTGNETEKLLEDQANIFAAGYQDILRTAEQGNAGIASADNEAKLALYRQAAAELDKYRQLHFIKANDSGKAFAEGLGSSQGLAAQKAAALAEAGVNALRSGISSFAAAGADSGTAYGNSFVNTAKSVIDRLINQDISADISIKNISALPVSFAADNITSRKTAVGGVFDRPTVRLIGEDGPEAVVPLEKNTGWIDKVADKVVKAMGNDNGAFNVVMENVNIYSGDDIDSLNYELEMSRRRTLAALGG